MSIVLQKHPTYGGDQKPETPGKRKSTFLHWKDVLDLGDHANAVTTTCVDSLLSLACTLVET